jgi:hypothetical protein
MKQKQINSFHLMIVFLFLTVVMMNILPEYWSKGETSGNEQRVK